MRWGPTDSRVDAFLECYRPGKERERDKVLNITEDAPTSNANNLKPASTEDHTNESATNNNNTVTTNNSSASRTGNASDSEELSEDSVTNLNSLNSSSSNNDSTSSLT